ncbi:hypothetical protein FRC01_014722, partial [Tulasnella sp. 417]
TFWTTPNAAKDFTHDVKQLLKILSWNEESERRLELTGPRNFDLRKSCKQQQVTHWQVIGSFRTTMRKNFKKLDIDKVQER